MRLLTGLATIVALVALAGCGDEATQADDPAPSCPSYAVVTGGPGGGAYTDFIVGVGDGTDLEPALADVGERLCLGLTQGRELGTGAVIVTSDRPLDAAGQDRLVAALEKVDGIQYAEPDTVVSLDPPSAQ